MDILKLNLLKRKKIGLLVLWTVVLLAFLFDHFYGFSPASYIPEHYRFYAVAFLLFYKMIELFIFYLLFYKKHYLKLLEEDFHFEFLKTFEKRSKQFFFLVPQGSIVFGILSYKITSIVWFVPLFVLIATITLLLVDPRKLREE